MDTTARDRLRRIIELDKYLDTKAPTSRIKEQNRGGALNNTNQVHVYEQLREANQTNYLLDKEGRQSGAWVTDWNSRRAFNGTVSARFLRRTVSGKYEVSYSGRRILAEGRGDTVLRLGDTVQLTSTSEGYSISW